MDPQKLTTELKKMAERKTQSLLDGHTPIANGTLAKAPPTEEPHLLVSLSNLRMFADALAVDIAMAYAHRVVDEEHCADCGEELDAELMFVLRNGRRLHPGCA